MSLASSNPVDLGLEHHRAGRYAQAEALYRKALAAQPNHAGALDLLGVLYGQTNRVAAGIELISRACAISPQTPLPWTHLGDLYRRSGMPDRAAQAFTRALQLDPTSAALYNDLGNSLVDQRKLAEAADAYRAAVRLDPRMDKAHSNLGVVLRELGQPGQAVSAFKNAIEVNPNSVIAYDNMGLALREDGQTEAAMAAHLRAIELDPQCANAFSNLSIALRIAQRYDEAVAASQKAIALNPSSADAYSNLGVTLAEMARLEESLAAYRKSLQLRPGSQEALTNMGNALAEQCRFAEGLEACRKGVEVNPANPIAHFNYALILLTLGDFERGWVEYEWRWKVPNLYLPRPFPHPRWDGKPLNGKTILLHADQGYGDTIQFMRYIPIIAQGGGRILLGCDKPLKPLFEGFPGISYVFTDNEYVPPFDVHLAVASLGAVFNANLETIPAHVPYIQARPDAVETWRRKLAPFDGQLKVGLAWQGRMNNPQQRKRAVHFSRLVESAGLAKLKSVTFFSLQKGDAASQAANPPTGMQFIDFTSEIHSFADTAGLLANLDWVISIDTAVAHLAGAMGKPVWTMIPFKPDWRWLINRDDSPWYPTMRLFRQRTIDQWDDVMERLGVEFRDIVNSKNQESSQISDPKSE